MEVEARRAGMSCKAERVLSMRGLRRNSMEGKRPAIEAGGGDPPVQGSSRRYWSGDLAMRGSIDPSLYRTKSAVHRKFSFLNDIKTMAEKIGWAISKSIH